MRNFPIALIACLAGIFVLTLLAIFSGNEPSANAKESVSDAHTLVFQNELDKDLAAKHLEVMSALDSQADSLSRIENNLAALSVEEAAKSVKTEPATEPVSESPVRMSTTRWSVDGAWNPSYSEMISHLSSHGVTADDGYTLEELHTIHDNLHNGYSAMGGVAASSSAGGWGRSRTVTRSYSSNGGGAVRSYASGGGTSRTYSSTRSGGLFSGRLLRNRSYSSCAGGSCR